MQPQESEQDASFILQVRCMVIHPSAHPSIHPAIFFMILILESILVWPFTHTLTKHVKCTLSCNPWYLRYYDNVQKSFKFSHQWIAWNYEKKGIIRLLFSVINLNLCLVSQFQNFSVPKDLVFCCKWCWYWQQSQMFSVKSNKKKKNFFKWCHCSSTYREVCLHPKGLCLVQLSQWNFPYGSYIIRRSTICRWAALQNTFL